MAFKKDKNKIKDARINVLEAQVEIQNFLIFKSDEREIAFRDLIEPMAKTYKKLNSEEQEYEEDDDY